MRIPNTFKLKSLGTIRYMFKHLVERYGQRYANMYPKIGQQLILRQL